MANHRSRLTVVRWKIEAIALKMSKEMKNVFRGPCVPVKLTYIHRGRDTHPTSRSEIAKLTRNVYVPVPSLKFEKYDATTK